MIYSNRHYIRLFLIAGINVSLYSYFFIKELPKLAKSSNYDDVLVNATHPLSIDVPQSITHSRKIKIAILREFCPHPIVNLRLVGPEIALLLPLSLKNASYNAVHKLEVDIPTSLLLGEYNVTATIIQCGKVSNTIDTTHSAALASSSCIIESEWKHMLNFGSNNSSGCAWAHLSSDTNEYVFTKVDRETNSIVTNNILTLKDGVKIAKLPSLDSSTDNSLIKSFEQLSNYELVCWLGDDDTKQYFQAFMGLYPSLSQGQRPFKFKYLKLDDISQPVKHFSETDHSTFNKCKIFFISYGIDRFDAGVEPQTYKQEVKVLIGHITKLLNADRRYDRRAWFLSPRSNTVKMANCRESPVLGRTPDRIQAFTEVIRQIFHEQNNRVNQSSAPLLFLDNSDITEAFWPSNSQQLELKIISIVAMGCMERIAQTVKEWRSNGQVGNIQGVMMNDGLIPNSELFKRPYNWEA